MKDVANELEAVGTQRKSSAGFRRSLEVAQEQLELGGGGVLHRGEGQASAGAVLRRKRRRCGCGAEQRCGLGGKGRVKKG